MSLTIGQAQNMIQSGQIRDGIGTLEINNGNQISKQGPATRPQEGDSFLSKLKDAIRDVDELQKESDSAAVDLATGHNKNIHEAMIAMEKADLALRTVTAVRNKILDAYHEIMRMQV